MKSIIFIVLCFSFIFVSNEKEDEDYKDFQNFMKNQKKNYERDELIKRFQIFKKNKSSINLSNHLSKKYEVMSGMQLRMDGEDTDIVYNEYKRLKIIGEPKSAFFEINKFGDISDEEFIEKYTNINQKLKEKIKTGAEKIKITKKDVPEIFDWREKKEIKDIDISKKIKLLENIDEETMKIALVEKGPLIIAIPAQYIKFLATGILDFWFRTLCKEEPNTLLTVVGYGEDGGVPYWIVKTPFGEDWGDKGYFKIRRGINTCQLANFTLLLED